MPGMQRHSSTGSSRSRVLESRPSMACSQARTYRAPAGSPRTWELHTWTLPGPLTRPIEAGVQSRDLKNSKFLRSLIHTHNTCTQLRPWPCHFYGSLHPCSPQKLVQQFLLLPMGLTSALPLPYPYMLPCIVVSVHKTWKASPQNIGIKSSACTNLDPIFISAPTLILPLSLFHYLLSLSYCSAYFFISCCHSFLKYDGNEIHVCYSNLFAWQPDKKGSPGSPPGILWIYPSRTKLNVTFPTNHSPGKIYLPHLWVSTTNGVHLVTVHTHHAIHCKHC